MSTPPQNRSRPEDGSAVDRYRCRLIAHDRGLAEAVRNDYYQPIGASQTLDGVTLTVDGVIADESRLVLFYTITDPEGNAGRTIASIPGS